MTKSRVKSALSLIGIYILLFAAMCPWPYQVPAYRLFVFITVLLTGIVILAAGSSKEIVDKTLKSIRERKEGYRWKGQKGKLLLTYLPIIFLLVMAGSWILATCWVIIFFICYGLTCGVLEKLREGSDGSTS